MNRTIFKYPLKPLDQQTVELPLMSKPLSVGLDPTGQLCLWALVDAKITGFFTAWKVWIVGTGKPVPDRVEETTFLGTVRQEAYMWHIFITTENKE